MLKFKEPFLFLNISIFKDEHLLIISDPLHKAHQKKINLFVVILLHWEMMTSKVCSICENGQSMPKEI